MPLKRRRRSLARASAAAVSVDTRQFSGYARFCLLLPIPKRGWIQPGILIY
jgi:hypothetical protein